MRKIAFVCAAALLVTGLPGCSTGTTSSASKSASQAAAASIGTPVRDGKLEFVVTGVSRSKTAGDPTNQFLQETAKGEFVNVALSVTNTGAEAQNYFASNQKLIVNGKQFDAATILGVPGDGDNINPGLGIDTVVSFDVPPGSVPEAIELHDSAFSGGVMVKLT